MPYARVRLITAGDTIIVYADENGDYSYESKLLQKTPIGKVVSDVAGSYFKILDADSSYFPFVLIDNNVEIPGVSDFVHNADTNSPRYRAAINAYVNMNRIRDYVLNFNSSFPGLSSSEDYKVQVNFPNLITDDWDCPGNAAYRPASQSFPELFNFCAAGEMWPWYANMAFSSIVFHEFGHMIIDKASGPQAAYGEGMGDAMSILMTDTSGLGYGYTTCGEPDRDADNDSMFPLIEEAHIEGMLLSGRIWDIRNALKQSYPYSYRDTLANLAVNSILLQTDSVINPQITINWLTLDDDDANLFNGTPNYDDICTGFAAHNMDCPAAPEVDSIVPGSDQENVLVSTNIEAVFDVDMDTSTINTSTFVVKKSGSQMEGEVYYIPDSLWNQDHWGGRAVFDPDEELDGPEDYTVELTTDIRSAVGFYLADTVSWSFRTAGPIPHVLDYSPDSLDYPISVNSNIEVLFDIHMNTVSFDSTTFVVTGSTTGSIYGSFSFSNDDKTVLFDPYSDFALGESVDVVLTTGIQSAGEGYLQDTFGWSFEVSNAPLIAALSPGQNALNVWRDANIGVTFDTDMDSTTFTASTIRVHASSTGLHSCTYSWDSPTKTLTIDPDDDFHAGEVVTVSLTDDIESAASNNLEGFVWSFAVESMSGFGLFGYKENYSVGVGPRAIAAADFDHDDDIDIAVTIVDDQDYYLTTLTNDGDGNLTTYQERTLGEIPWSISCGDVNSDYDIDLMTTNVGAPSISKLLGGSNASFSTQSEQNYYGDYPVQGILVDVDADGDLDLPIADLVYRGINVYKNSGGGSFSHNSYCEDDYKLNGLTACDFDNDGDLDIAAPSHQYSAISLYSNDGTGTLSGPVHLEMDQDPYAIWSADLDGDGYVDLITANKDSDSVSVLLNDGAGSFDSPTDYEIGNYPLFVISSDFDGDGYLDIAAALGGGYVSILINDGDGTFGEPSTYSALGGTSWITAADMDNDGDMDLIAGNTSSTKISVLTNISCVPGDADASGGVDIDDVVYIIAYIFNGGPAPIPMVCCADADGSGSVDNDDTIYLIAYIYTGGPAPVASCEVNGPFK
jgi:hypothetical protein